MTFSPRTVVGVTMWQSLALLLPVGVVGWSDLAVGQVLATALLTALVWEMMFAGLRKRAISAHGVTTALIVTLFCPADIALWQLAVALSLGVVLGELIFGGRGFGFVSPAALSLSLLIVAFPEVALRATTPEVALAVLPGLALLLAMGLVSIAVLASVGVGTFLLLAVTGQPVDPSAIAVALSVGTVFLFADPTAASTTPHGRWVYGLLAGGLVVIFSPTEQLITEAVVAAALFASVFAPLIDYLAVILYVRRRGHG